MGLQEQHVLQILVNPTGWTFLSKVFCLINVSEMFFYSCVLFPAEIQKMKNAVPKNDKKKRKQLTEEIAKLEADLNQKHEVELRQLASHTKVKTSVKGLLDRACCDTRGPDGV